MKNLSFLAIASFALVGCGDDGGGNGGNADAAPDVSSMLTISGVASEITTGGRTPQEGVAITVYKTSDDSVMGMATTDANGAYSITVSTNGSPVDGYLKATKTGLKDTYLYPPGPLSSDFAGVTTLMLKQSTQNLANQVGGAAAPDPTKGWVGVLVLDGASTSSMPVEGATVTANPTGEIRYNGGAGIPQAQAMATAADGIAYAMNVPAGQVTIGASKSGLNLKAHAINARADKITLTLVTP
jgi:hypothetical protein